VRQVGYNLLESLTTSSYSLEEPEQIFIIKSAKFRKESGLESALNRHTVRPFTESDDTRGCNDTICPPEDEQGTARNMLRIII
jgi:hypothetical protein